MTNPVREPASTVSDVPEQTEQPAESKSVRRASSQNTSKAVFDAVLRNIISGAYPPGGRLPAERELARELGASRPTLREALRRLTEWQLVEPKRGSGVVVRPPSEWSIEALPAYLRYGGSGSLRLPASDILRDLLALRRSLLVEIIGLTAGRLGPGQLDPARDAATRAWSVRSYPRQFLSADFRVIRAVVEAAGCYPALWFFNRLAGVYFDVAGSVAGVLAPPDDYMESHRQVFEALEAHDRARAVTLMGDYLDRHDHKLLRMLPERQPPQPMREPEATSDGD